MRATVLLDRSQASTTPHDGGDGWATPVAALGVPVFGRGNAQTYRAGKWGRYVHAPDFYFGTARVFREQTGVSRSNVESGTLRILEAGDGSLHPIEARYVSPEVHSLMKVTRPVVRPGDVDRVVLLVGDDDDKKGVANKWVRQYLRYGFRGTERTDRSPL